MRDENIRQALQLFPYGVAVVATRVGDMVHGFTASWVSQLSIEPTVVGVAIAKTAKAHELIRQTGNYSVSLLAGGQEEIARAFAAPSGERGGEELFQVKSCGPPILQDCRGWVEVTLTEVASTGGDHDLFLGQVTSAALGERADEEPLILNASDLPFYGA